MTALVFLAVLSILVLIHELGHFAVAKWLKIKVEEFALGLPLTPPIFKFKKGETQYAVYPVLFGGFVKLYGEEGPAFAEASARHRDFWSRGRKQRMAVVGAGVVMNIVLAVAGFVVLYSVVGVPQKTVNKVTILEVEGGSPAEKAGLRTNDRVVAVEGKAIEEGEEFVRLMRSWAGLSVNLTVQRGEGIYLLEGIAQEKVEEKVIAVVPDVKPPEGRGPLGVRIGEFPYLETEKCVALSAKCIGGAVGVGFGTTGKWIVRVVDGLRGIGRSLAAGRPPEGLGGPIQIYNIVDVVSKGGVLPLIELTAVLSVNLAVFNVLPIPALDGGRMFFIWLEWVRRKRVSAELEQKINSWGMAFLIALLVVISLQDVVKMGWVGKIVDWKKLILR